MSVVQISGGTQAAAVTNGGNVTLILPPLQPNDVVIVFGGHPEDRAGVSVTPSGFNSIYDSGQGNGRPRFGVSYRIMGESPDTSVLCPGSGNTADAIAYGCYCLRNVDIAAIVDAAPALAGPLTTSNPDCPAITTLSDKALVLALAISRVNDTAITNPTGYGNQRSASASDTSSCSVCGATREVSPPGIENPSAFTAWASNTWRAITIAIKPGIIQVVGLPTEADEAPAAGIIKTSLIGQSLATDTAFAASALRSLSIALANDTATALGVSFFRSGAKIIGVGPASATDMAWAASIRRTLTAAPGNEGDAASAMVADRMLQLAQAASIDMAEPLGRHKRRVTGQAGETDEGFTATARRIHASELGGEQDEALAPRAIRIHPLVYASAIDAAFGFGRHKTRPVVSADEFDLAAVLGIDLPVRGWPLDVPQSALRDGYGEDAEDNVAEFTPEVGPPMLRRRFSQTKPLLTFATVMTAEQYAELLAFYRVTLRQGTEPFNRAHPRTGVVGRFRFLSPPRAQAARAVDRFRVEMRIR